MVRLYVCPTCKDDWAIWTGQDYKLTGKQMLEANRAVRVAQGLERPRPDPRQLAIGLTVEAVGVPRLESRGLDQA